MPLLGPGWPLRYARLLSGPSNWNVSSAVDPGHMQNWRGFSYVLLAGRHPDLVAVLFLSLSALSIGVLCWAWWHTREGARAHDGTAQADLVWALTCIVALLTALHLNPHDLTLLIVPAWIVAAYVTSTGGGRWGGPLSRLWLLLLWTGYLLRWLLLLDSSPVAEVVPTVLLLALAAGLLAWQIMRRRARGGLAGDRLPSSPALLGPAPATSLLGRQVPIRAADPGTTGQEEKPCR
jgi:hypothetical protein